MKNLILFLVAVIAVMLVGCGGGGGSASNDTIIKGIIYDAQGNTVADANVYLTKIKNSKAYDYSIKTNSQGKFEFKNVVPAYYYVEMTKGNKKTETYVQAIKNQTVTIPKSETTFDTEKGNAKVKILKNNQPVKDIKVILTNNINNLSALSNEKGVAEFSNIATGKYKVTVENYSESGNITVTKDKTSEITLNISDKDKSKITLIFYANSYNLDDGLTMNLKQMYKYGSTNKLNVVVQYKLSDNKVYRGKITKTDGSNLHYGLNEISKTNFGLKENLSSYINWAKENYPAEKYILILWNHGSGWTPFWDTKAINHDNEFTDFLECYEVHEAIQGKNIYALLTDACVMEYIEFLTYIKNDVKYSLSTEAETPSVGFNYTNLLGKLNECSDIVTALKEFAEIQIKDPYWERFDSDIKLNDLAKVDTVNQSIKEMADYLIQNKEKYSQEIHTAKRQSAIIYNYGVDMDSFVNRIKESIKDTAFQNIIKKYENSRDKLLVYKGITYNKTSFLINMPFQNEYNIDFKNSYPKTPFAQATNWDKFLENCK